MLLTLLTRLLPVLGPSRGRGLVCFYIIIYPVGTQNTPPCRRPLLNMDYSELKAIENQQTRKKPFQNLPSVTKDRNFREVRTAQNPFSVRFLWP